MRRNKIIVVDSWKDFFQSTALVWAFITGAALTIAWFGLPLWVVLCLVYWIF